MYVLFGVPIYGGKEERIAHEARIQLMVDQQVAHAEATLVVRDAVLLPPVFPGDVASRHRRNRAVSRQAFELMSNHSRCLDHVVKCTSVILVQPALLDLDKRRRQIQRAALRLPPGFPDSCLGFLNRCPSASGVGARPTTQIANAALIGAHTAVWARATGLLKDPSPTSLVSRLTHAAVSVRNLHTELRTRHEADLADPGMPTPPAALFDPKNVPELLQKLVFDPINDNKPPTRVHQRDISRTRDHCDMQHDWFHPVLD